MTIDNTLTCELATLETYNELKYSSFSSNISDRPESLMLSKLAKQLSDYAKDRPSHPIFLMLNIGNAIDVGVTLAKEFFNPSYISRIVVG